MPHFAGLFLLLNLLLLLLFLLLLVSCPLGTTNALSSSLQKSEFGVMLGDPTVIDDPNAAFPYQWKGQRSEDANLIELDLDVNVIDRSTGSESGADPFEMGKSGSNRSGTWGSGSGTAKEAGTWDGSIGKGLVVNVNLTQTGPAYLQYSEGSYGTGELQKTAEVSMRRSHAAKENAGGVKLNISGSGEGKANADGDGGSRGNVYINVTVVTATPTSPSNNNTQNCCPQGGIWGNWTVNGTCSDTCGACGKQRYTRLCLSDSWGCACLGDSTMTMECNRNPCIFPRLSCCHGYSAKPDKSTRTIVCGTPVPIPISPTPLCANTTQTGGNINITVNGNIIMGQR